MPGRSAAFTCRSLAVALLLILSPAIGAASGLIVKPPDGSWIPGDAVEIIARCTDCRLLLDGKALEAEEPFPGVFRVAVTVPAGEHVVRLDSQEVTQEVTFRAGASPSGDQRRPYTDHPPVATACTHCHSVSRRGRFRFSGGCDTCHAREPFIRTHSHEPHEIASCGMCHDAHGSSSASLLLMAKERACKQCHN